MKNHFINMIRFWAIQFNLIQFRTTQLFNTIFWWIFRRKVNLETYPKAKCIWGSVHRGWQIFSQSISFWGQVPGAEFQWGPTRFLRSQHFLCSFEAKMGQNVQPRAKIWVKINLLYLRNVLIVSLNVNPIQDGYFRASHGCAGGGGAKSPPLPKICPTY